MIDQIEYQSLMRNIVADSFADELPVFNMEVERISDDLWSGEDLSACERADGEFHFATEATAVLSFVSLMASTFLALQKVYAKVVPNKAISIDDVAEVWKAELIKAGISSRKATSIVSKFSGDVVRLTTKTK